MLHSGIDLHKRTVVISTVDPSGHPVRDAELPTSRARIQSYFASLPGPHRAVVESTSNWYWLSDLLLSSGVDLRLGHSKYIKAISYAKVKTDAVDAATLAQLLRSDLVPEAHMVSPEWREARDLLRARLQIVGQQVRCKNTVEGLLAQYNVTSLGALPPLVQLRTQLLDEQMQLLSTQAKRLEHELHPLLIPTEDVQRLLWVPGIGKLVALTIVLEVDGIERFPSGTRIRLLLPPRAWCWELGWQDQTQADQGRESLPEDRLQPCRGASNPILPRDPALLSSSLSSQATRGSTRSRGERVGSHRLLHAQEAGGLQRHLQRETTESHKAAEVATAGEPVRLTGAALRPRAVKASTSAAFDWDPRRSAAELPLGPILLESRTRNGVWPPPRRPPRGKYRRCHRRACADENFATKGDGYHPAIGTRLSPCAGTL